MNVRKLLCLLLLLGLLMGCNAENEYEAPIYEGKGLNIGVIGDEPNIREQNIHFKNISFEELESEMGSSSNGIDAVFIMEDFLKQAGENKYTNVYRELNLPIFFIESKKSYVPFVNDDITYNEFLDVDDKMYITGIMSTDDDTFNTWGFGLYNDTKNDTNIKSVYSGVFETIESEGR